MHRDCLGPDGKDDLSKGNQLMDIYALEIAMESQRENFPKLRSLYERAMKIPGLANPRVSGVIHECGGKMHMRERNWQNAFTDFFEAFKNFDDAGLRSNSSQCLKYLVLANMLSNSDINPFHEQRARSYQDNTEIKAMISLVENYQKRHPPLRRSFGCQQGCFAWRCLLGVLHGRLDEETSFWSFGGPH